MKNEHRHLANSLSAVAQPALLAIKPVTGLLEHEFEALLEALRRDLRHQYERSQSSDADRSLYGYYYRQDLRLLEALNPKHPPPAADLVASLSATSSR